MLELNWVQLLDLLGLTSSYTVFSKFLTFFMQEYLELSQVSGDRELERELERAWGGGL